MARAVDIAGLVTAYRRLVLWFGAQFLLPLATAGLEVATAGERAEQMPCLPTMLLTVALMLGAFAVFVALLIYSYETAKALGSTVPWLWAAGMLVPLLSLLVLLALSVQATRACRERGIPVGFFGPKVGAGD